MGRPLRGSAEVVVPDHAPPRVQNPHRLARRAGAAVLMVGALVTTTDIGFAGAATANFTVTGSLATARASAISARLANGQVLIAGGEAADGTPLSSAELYNPTTAS